MNRINRKKSGTIILNAVMILSIAVLVIGFSNAYFERQVRNYQKLDEKYRQEIINNTKINNVKFMETLQPLELNRFRR
ncbi:hypothetical protein [Companilactobacillus nodensis]|uniref:hypothetical protein n=1 Tax=Companilactobacillus nodensis TaxID=460870 RepID=UPI000469ED0F|nr:hypothetical protein [Companilactobacillus nodensis]